MRVGCFLVLLLGALLPATAAPRPLLAPVPAEVASTHFVVTVDGRETPVLHAAMNLYFLNFEASRNARITVTADRDGFWDSGVEVEPWRLGIRPTRTGRTLSFRLKGPQKITISRPGDFGSDAEMLFLFANPAEPRPPTAATAGVRYFGPGVHRENIDARSGDRIYLAPGAVVFGSLNLWQVDHVTVSGRGVIVYDGPQNPADDDGWMHKPNWHCIVMDKAHEIRIDGITCVVRSRTWQIQMKDSRGILFNNVKVIGANAGNANADGLDWLGGGDTVVRDSFIRAADDVFALQTSWDGYGAESFSHQGEPVTGIRIEGGVFSTSISNIVRAGWPGKNFEGGQLAMTDSDVIHAGLGGCGIPFALMELWADPDGRGRSGGYTFENVRLDHWYSLMQLMQPAEGVSGVTLRDVTGMETPALVASTLKGSIHDVTLTGSGFAGTPPHDAVGQPLRVLDGADAPMVSDAPRISIEEPAGLLRPHQKVALAAVVVGGDAANLSFHWTFGDGTEATGARVKHRFPDADGTLHDGSGRFRVLVEATDGTGRHLRASLPVVVADALRPGAENAVTSPGLRYTVSNHGAEETGVATELSLAAVPHPAAGYRIAFDGLLNVPDDGGYTFWLVANEDATVELDGVPLVHNWAPIVQVCGLAGMAAQGTLASAALARGPHRLRVMETHGEGADDFRLLWQGPGFALAPIPPAALLHPAAAPGGSEPF